MMEDSIVVQELRRTLLVAIRAPTAEAAALGMVLLVAELIKAIEDEEED